MRKIVALFAILLFCGSYAMAQPPSDVAGKVLTPSDSVDTILDALQARGEGLKDFTADVRLLETDNLTQDTTSRSGEVWYQNKGNGDARIRVLFNSKQIGDRRPEEDKREYLLNDGSLVERDYTRKFEMVRQVLQPGQKVNVLKLGEGPFPLPIGQSREDVYKQFDVKKIEPSKDDPANTVHLQLIPKPDSQFERKFKQLDVWVETKDHFPQRVQTLDRSESTTRTTDFSNIKVNSGLSDKDFELAKINEKEWTLHEERY